MSKAFKDVSPGETLQSSLENKEAERLLVDLEYYFKKYFDTNCARMVDKVVKDVKAKQVAEAQSIREKYSSGYHVNTGSGGIPVHSMMTEMAVSSGEWNNKGVTDVLKMCDEKLYKDSAFCTDYSVLVVAYREALVSEIGKKRYERLNARSKSGDVAADYVQARFQRMTVERLVKNNLPANTLDYILREGAGSSLFGFASVELPSILGEARKDHKAVTDKLGYESLDAAIKDFYKPSTAARIGRETMGLLGDVGISGGWIGIGIDALYRGGSIIKEIHEDTSPTERTYDQDYSKEVFGRDDTVDHLRKAGVSMRSVSSVELYRLNQVMSKPVKGGISKPVQHLNPHENISSLKDLFVKAGNDGHAVFSVAEDFVNTLGFNVNNEKSVPQWMLKQDLGGCAHNSAYYFGIAVEMMTKGSERIAVGKNILTLSQVVQRGYDYARAAEVKQQELDAQLTMNREEIARQEADLNALMSSRQEEMKRQRQAAAVQQTASEKIAHFERKDQDVSGWGTMLDSLGLRGFSAVGRNFGYVLSMLPELMIGMFTGKLKNFKLSDNLLPLAAIMVGFFMRNPLLKMLLIGLGGASLLNQATHTSLGQEGRCGRQQEGFRPYRSYADEPLDARVSNPVLKGNTLIASIDGVPCVATISDDVSEAYHQGKIPINTLSNVVLRKWDEQKSILSTQYERGMAESDFQAVSRGLK